MRIFAFLPLLFLGRVAFAHPVDSRDVAVAEVVKPSQDTGKCPTSAKITCHPPGDSRDVAGRQRTIPGGGESEVKREAFGDHVHLLTLAMSLPVARW